jgi:hypothetical protein
MSKKEAKVDETLQDSKMKKKESTALSNVVAGTVVGSLQSVLFNPWDRALYLSVKEKRAFLLKENFRNPYQAKEQKKKKK